MIVRGIACDECSEVAKDEARRVIVYPRVDDVRAEAKELGWTMVRGKDRCPGCKG